MDIDWIKLYGPLGMGWLAAVYLGKRLLDLLTESQVRDIESRMKLAEALDALTKTIEFRQAAFTRIEAMLDKVNGVNGRA